jgi:predicted exporter
MTRGDRAAVMVWLAVLLCCGYWLVRHLAVTADLSAFLPAAATRSQALLVQQLREGPASRLILIGVDGAESAALAKASGDLARRIRANVLFAMAGNGDPALLADERTRIEEWRYLLSPAVDPDRFTVASLRDALVNDLELLTSPLGAAIKGTLPADPTGEMRRLGALFAGQGAPASLHGVWFSSDGRRALLLAQTRAPGFDAVAQERAVDAVRDAFAAVAPDGAHLLIAGPGVFAAEARHVIARDAGRASLFTSIAVLALLFAIYRSLRPTLMSALPAMSGLVVGITAVGAWFGPVHAITLGFGAMLIGEAVDYPTYLFANAAPGERLSQTMARIGRTFAIAVLTTVLGATAMLLSNFRGLAQLGLFTMVGVGTAGLVTRFVLPALTPTRAFERKTTRLPFDANRGFDFLHRNAWALAVLLAGAVFVVIVHRDGLWDDDLASLNPVPEATKAVDRELRSQLGAPDVRYAVLVRDATRDDVLRKSERLADVLDGAVERKWLGGFDAASRFLPSRPVQMARRASLPPPAVLAANLAEAAAGLPYREGLFAPFLAAVERTRTGPLIERDAYRDTAIGLKIDSLLFESDGEWIAVVPLVGVREPASLEQHLRSGDMPGVHWLDLKGEAGELVSGYRQQSLRSIAIGIACIALLLYAGLRSVGLVLRVAAPVAAAVVLTMGALLALGHRLTIFHLVAMLLVVGVGLNYALFFNRDRRDDAERNLMLLSVFIACAATLLAAVALAFSMTPVLRAIGITTALGATFAFVSSAALCRTR